MFQIFNLTIKNRVRIGAIISTVRDENFTIHRVVHKIIVGAKEKEALLVDGRENSLAKVFSPEEHFLSSRWNACSRACSRIRMNIHIRGGDGGKRKEKREKVC